MSGGNVSPNVKSVTPALGFVDKLFFNPKKGSTFMERKLSASFPPHIAAI